MRKTRRMTQLNKIRPTTLCRAWCQCEMDRMTRKHVWPTEASFGCTQPVRIGSGLGANPGWNPSPVNFCDPIRFSVRLSPLGFLTHGLGFFFDRGGHGTEPGLEGYGNESRASDNMYTRDERRRRRNRPMSGMPASWRLSASPATSTVLATFSLVGTSLFC